MPELSPVVEDDAERPAVEVAEALLGKRLKVKTTDDRDFTGTLICLDHLGNVLLFDAVEHCSLGEYKQERSLGQILIPMRIVKQALIKVEEDDKVLQILLEDEIKAMKL